MTISNSFIAWTQAITLLGRAWLASNEVAEDVAVMALETWYLFESPRG
jgi:hypothetical protein